MMEGSHHDTRASAGAHLPQLSKQEPNDLAVRRKPVPNFSRGQRRSTQSTGSSQEEDPYYDCQSEDVEPGAIDPRSSRQPKDEYISSNSRSTYREENAHSAPGPRSKVSPLPVPNRVSSRNPEPSQDAREEHRLSGSGAATTATHVNSSNTPTNQQRSIHDSNVDPTPRDAEKWLDNLSNQFAQTSVQGDSHQDTTRGQPDRNHAPHPAGPRPQPGHKHKAPADDVRHAGSSASSRTAVSQRGQRPSTESDSKPTADEILERAHTNTTDTTYHQKYLPPVTHETVRHQVHHIREEAITREIHHHDVYHRIQPVTQVEVLPARHFVQTAAGTVEVPASQVPGRSRDWHVAVGGAARQPGEGAVRQPGDGAVRQSGDGQLPGPGRRFTAREFPGTEGDATSYVSPEDGVWRTEQTWVHPPTMATGGRDSPVN